MKSPNELIEDFIGKLNDSSSLHVDSFFQNNPTTTIRWWRILLYPCLIFLKVYFVKLKILKGVDGFITARLAAIDSLVTNVKLWEYQMRKKEGKAFLPPTTIEQIKHHRHKYF